MFKVGDIVKVSESVEKTFGKVDCDIANDIKALAGKEVEIIENSKKDNTCKVRHIGKDLWLGYSMLIPLSKVEDDEIPINEDIEFYIEENKSCDRFEKVTEEMSKLYAIKNANYGNSFSEQFKEYGMTSVCIRLDDKLRRLKSLNSMGSNGTNDESIRDTLIDAAVYSVLAIMELDNKGE